MDSERIKPPQTDRWRTSFLYLLIERHGWHNPQPHNDRTHSDAELLARIVELRGRGDVYPQIANLLNEEKWAAPFPVLTHDTGELAAATVAGLLAELPGKTVAEDLAHQTWPQRSGSCCWRKDFGRCAENNGTLLAPPCALLPLGSRRGGGRLQPVLLDGRGRAEPPTFWLEIQVQQIDSEDRFGGSVQRINSANQFSEPFQRIVSFAPFDYL